MTQQANVNERIKTFLSQKEDKMLALGSRRVSELEVIKRREQVFNNFIGMFSAKRSAQGTR